MPSASAKTTGEAKRPTIWFLFQWVCWNFIVALSAITTLYATSVILSHNWLSAVPKASAIIPGQPLINNFVQLAHILTAVPCLVLGPWLFFEILRNKSLRIHRILGKTYVIGIFISAPLGLALAVVNQFGIFAQLGFTFLSIVWFTTTLMAYLAIRKGNRVKHRRWMIRSYSLSLAVVTVRFLSPPGDMPLEVWFPILTWLCWVPNLAIGEVYARITRHTGELIWMQRKSPT